MRTNHFLLALIAMSASVLPGCTDNDSAETAIDFSQPARVSVLILDVNATLSMPELTAFRHYNRVLPPLMEATWDGNELGLSTDDAMTRLLIEDGDFIGLVRIHISSPYHDVVQEHVVIGNENNPPRLFPLDQEYDIVPFNDRLILEIWGGGQVYDGSAPLLASHGEARSMQEFNGEYRTGHDLIYTVPMDHAYVTTFFSANAHIEYTFQYARQATVVFSAPDDFLDDDSRGLAERLRETTGRFGTITADCRVPLVVGYSPCLSPWMWNPVAPAMQ